MIKYFIIGYLLVVNLFGYIIMGIDKRRAIDKRWRVKEKSLFLIAALGGSIGCIVGMKFFRHKTKHVKFTIGMPCILLLQFILFVYIIYLKF
jgi:uncharacterized membrane protein YsdA (DUF1294 family)